MKLKFPNRTQVQLFIDRLKEYYPECDSISLPTQYGNTEAPFTCSIKGHLDTSDLEDIENMANQFLGELVINLVML